MILCRRSKLSLPFRSTARLPFARCRHFQSSSNSNTSNRVDIQAFFDDPTCVQTCSSRKAAGLLGMRHLRKPKDLQRAAQQTRIRCERLADQIAAPPSTISPEASPKNPGNPLEQVVKQMDTLSDMICATVDLAELLRNVHPDPEWARASEQAYKELGSFIHQLNTRRDLYEALKKPYANLKWRSELSPEAARVARLFLQDFEKSGIHMAAAERRKLVDWNDEINAVGHRFMRSKSAPVSDRVQTLERMLLLRAQLADFLGYPSFADFYLQDKMAQSPERVMQFLEPLSRNNLPKALQSTPTKGFFQSPLRDKPRERGTVGSVMKSIGSLFQQLYGIQLLPAEGAPNEVWDPSVRRLDVTEENGDRLGIIYCDLFRRTDPESHPKCPNPAQFTVRCRRRIDNDSKEFAFPPEYYQDLRYLGTSQSPDRKAVYQLPVVVLSCNFPQDGGTLSWRDVETLYHEMGHALHSMVAFTDFQHVSGTRCQLDFVEIPSILMEYFANATHQPNPALPMGGTSALDMQQQLFYAILDQRLHSAQVLRPGFSSTEIYRQTMNQHHTASYISGTQPHVDFDHLYGYGAGYYSYVWSRVFAERVFQDVFAPLAVTEGRKREDAMRRAGECWREQVLRFGGAKDPWEMNWDRLTKSDPREGLFVSSSV